MIVAPLLDQPRQTTASMPLLPIARHPAVALPADPPATTRRSARSAPPTPPAGAGWRALDEHAEAPAGALGRAVTLAQRHAWRDWHRSWCAARRADATRRAVDVKAASVARALRATATRRSLALWWHAAAERTRYRRLMRLGALGQLSWAIRLWARRLRGGIAFLAALQEAAPPPSPASALAPRDRRRSTTPVAAWRRYEAAQAAIMDERRRRITTTAALAAWRAEAALGAVRRYATRLPPRLRRTVLRWRFAAKALGQRRVFYRARQVAAALGAASLESRRLAGTFADLRAAADRRSRVCLAAELRVHNALARAYAHLAMHATHAARCSRLALVAAAAERGRTLRHGLRALQARWLRARVPRFVASRLSRLRLRKALARWHQTVMAGAARRCRMASLIGKVHAALNARTMRTACRAIRMDAASRCGFLLLRPLAMLCLQRLAWRRLVASSTRSSRDGDALVAALVAARSAFLKRAWARLQVAASHRSAGAMAMDLAVAAYDALRGSKQWAALGHWREAASSARRAAEAEKVRKAHSEERAAAAAVAAQATAQVAAEAAARAAAEAAARQVAEAAARAAAEAEERVARAESMALASRVTASAVASAIIAVEVQLQRTAAAEEAARQRAAAAAASAALQQQRAAAAAAAMAALEAAEAAEEAKEAKAEAEAAAAAEAAARTEAEAARQRAEAAAASAVAMAAAETQAAAERAEAAEVAMQQAVTDAKLSELAATERAASAVEAAVSEAVAAERQAAAGALAATMATAEAAAGAERAAAIRAKEAEWAAAREALVAAQAEAQGKAMAEAEERASAAVEAARREAHAMSEAGKAAAEVALHRAISEQETAAAAARDMAQALQQEAEAAKAEVERATAAKVAAEAEATAAKEAAVFAEATARESVQAERQRAKAMAEEAVATQAAAEAAVAQAKAEVEAARQEAAAAIAQAAIAQAATDPAVVLADSNGKGVNPSAVGVVGVQPQHPSNSHADGDEGLDVELEAPHDAGQLSALEERATAAEAAWLEANSAAATAATAVAEAEARAAAAEATARRESAAARESNLELSQALQQLEDERRHAAEEAAARQEAEAAAVAARVRAAALVHAASVEASAREAALCAELDSQRAGVNVPLAAPTSKGEVQMAARAEEVECGAAEAERELAQEQLASEVRARQESAQWGAWADAQEASVGERGRDDGHDDSTGNGGCVALHEGGDEEDHELAYAIASWQGACRSSPEQREYEAVLVSSAMARLAMPKRLRTVRVACIRLQRTWRRCYASRGLVTVNGSSPGASTGLATKSAADGAEDERTCSDPAGSAETRSAVEADHGAGAPSPAVSTVRRIDSATFDLDTALHAAEGLGRVDAAYDAQREAQGETDEEDDPPDWLMSAAEDVGVSVERSAISRRESTVPALAEMLAATAVDGGSDDDLAQAASGRPGCRTPSPPSQPLPTPTPTAVFPTPTPLTDRNGVDCTPHTLATKASTPFEAGSTATFSRPYTPRSSRPQLAPPLPASELLRRARRRLAMVAVSTGVTSGTASTAGDDDGDDEEVLGKIYFLHTRRAGRRLLGAWLAWRTDMQCRG